MVLLADVSRRVTPPKRSHEQAHPLAPEIDQQRRGGAHVQHDEEGQESRRLLVDVPAKHGR
jgi:hypothetical protein